MISNIQTEQQTIIARGRIVEALFIQDQRVRQRTHFQEMMPIAGVAGEPRHFQPENQPHMSESDLSRLRAGTHDDQQLRLPNDPHLDQSPRYARLPTPALALGRAAHIGGKDFLHAQRRVGGLDIKFV